MTPEIQTAVRRLADAISALSHPDRPLLAVGKVDIKSALEIVDRLDRAELEAIIEKAKPAAPMLLAAE